MLNYRTVGDLNAHILSALPKLSRNIDLVVGIPRSGYLAGSLFALHLNCALTDPQGLMENRILSYGISRKGYRKIQNVADARSILVVDDSIYSGTQMTAVRLALAKSPFAGRFIFAAVYALPESKNKVDFYCDICPEPRMFEWNMMHGHFLGEACVDMDGVICCDPTEEENDDGQKYREFIENARPLLLPTTPVGYVVTCRLEKYRRQTEAWLKHYGVRYKRLYMMNLPTKAARLALGSHAAFKAAIAIDLKCRFFLESSFAQAREIADLAGIHVFCNETRSIIYPCSSALIKQAIKTIPTALYKLPQKLIRKAHSLIVRRLGR